MILAGVAGLLAKSWLAGSIGELGRSYLGNVAVSYAVYFWVSLATRARLGRAVNAALALLMVEVFELADGFGIMANVYDPCDYPANALGVGLAVLVDEVTARIIAEHPGSGGMPSKGAL